MVSSFILGLRCENLNKFTDNTGKTWMLYFLNLAGEVSKRLGITSGHAHKISSKVGLILGLQQTKYKLKIYKKLQ